MAEISQESSEQKTSAEIADSNNQVKPIRHILARARSESSEEREQRLKMLRDKQNEERQRKLEELKAQALAAQHFREMKEQERRKRIDEFRVKENDKRQQVGERKRLIYEAERDRRESILKKNQERELRFEMKRKNDRGSLAFAFGSSTPRMLEPADTGGSFWGYRKATSTSNILFSALPLTRRSSERELDGSKKRATSASGLDRNNLEGTEEIIPAGCASGHMGRRRTDLMPTIPLRDAGSSLAKRPFTKSPGSSRPGSSLSQQSTSSVSSAVNIRTRPITASRKPRPASIAVTGITHDSNKNAIINESYKKSDLTKPPLPKTRKSSVDKSLNDKLDKAKKATQKVTPKMNSLQSPSTELPSVETVQNVMDKSISEVPPIQDTFVEENIPVTKETKAIVSNLKKPIMKNELQDNEKKQDTEVKQNGDEILKVTEDKPQSEEKISITEVDLPEENLNVDEAIICDETAINSNNVQEITSSPSVSVEKTLVESENILENAEMTASTIAKIRITTEEEAKAALAERRRLAREEAERQALAEKLRIEQEEERQRQEEEQLRLLAEEQRKAEEERLAQAIREAQKREEDERLRREEELKQKLEKEEQERKLREENEKKKIEMEERLKIEESEREARRKRVEAIMLRTRAKGSPGSLTKNDGDNEKNDIEDENKTDVVNNKPNIEIYDKTSTEQQESLLNGTLKSQWPIISQENGDKDSQCSNGHKNKTDNTENLRRDNHSLIEHNVTNTLLAFDTLRNNTLDLSTNKIKMEDNVNSNNPTDSEGTRDLLL